MLRLSIDSIISKIQAEKPFHAIAEDYSFWLKIDSYSHYICGAVHDGHQFRKELWSKCLHSEYERWYEEDPATKNMIQSHPIVIAGCDSRFEYDLNRAPEVAVYEDAWGKQLWKNSLKSEVKERSLEKHHNFYKVVHALVSKIESKYGAAIVYDIHSYNWRRWDREVPVINLGTSNIDTIKYASYAESWRTTLSEIQLPYQITATAAINDTFQGNGYFLKYITKHFKSTLVLATEFSKIYCHELEYIMYPEVVLAIENELKTKIPEHAKTFYKDFIH
ncbi:N-formylglutamate amidohydrolase [Aquimarina sp. MMG016]|uniref:N-formylglutamate amidohydrolase n=1 Tax=Aquimarina sp. MMG016 TaxID=2822690 RepID=UPI001B3A0299|nr:N-formylglutamate amidohydrolase [Aquimarina sp. MMG016]MBQ4819400.1 N-formylglutamate amidohydrolase [Aquimarina sp. MMG016]